MSESTYYRWNGATLEPGDGNASQNHIAVADSWLVTEGTALALDLHRQRFTGGIDPRYSELKLNEFWHQALALIPRTGDWFPRVELRTGDDKPQLIFMLRPTPELTKSVRVATWDGPDPRSEPLTKGPDTDALLRIRTAIQQRGAEEAIIVSPNGYVVEGAYSSLLWWRGDFICAPSPELARVDSVTARSMITLAAALGVDVHYESVTPHELDGLEVWALSALHGPRIITEWVDGPALAEQPGRLGLWRARLARLRRPLN